MPRLPISILLGMCFLLLSCNSKAQRSVEDGKHPYTNELINSSSPYLLQHAHNPVNWRPWGEKALKKAKKENKLLLISIGYAACHWCHVMEHESFEDTAVAKLMNDHFVPIKVDREERPDVGQIYMDAAMLINQRGGWPLNAIALPDGRPIFVGTYFPKKEWTNVLNFFKDVLEKQPDKVESQAESLARGISRMNFTELAPKAENLSLELLDQAFKSIEKRIDFKKGGLSGAPKFPMPVIYEFLLEHYYYTQDPKALEAATTTLDAMQKGGIYDHLRGGFARYSTDGDWKVPHFEKMLYDNGQLVSLYSKAYQLTKDPSFKQTVVETLDWIEAEMTDPSGGFYSSLDADSEGEEGKFYVWEAQEIDELLEENAALFKEVYEVKEKGNWEEKNILFIKKDLNEIASAYQLGLEDFQDLMISSKEKLLAERSKRIRPGLDDKILTSWNALMLRGYVDAYNVFQEPKYLEKALENASFILKNCLRKDGGLNRNYKNGKSSINAFADDYSFTIEAFTALYQATFDEKWLFEAEKLMAYAIEHFYDEASGTFFYTSDLDPALIARSRELQDNVIPASNSSFAKGLFALGTYLEKADYKEKAELILAQALPNLDQSAPFFANYGLLLNRFVHEPYEVAIVGEDAAEKLKEWNREFHAGVYLLGGKEEGKLALLENKKVPGATYIYVCKDKVCKLPVQEVQRAYGLLGRD